MFRAEINVAVEFHGTEYGGFGILRDSLTAESIVVSCGIGEDASFDLALIRKYGCRIQAFDPTPKSIAWVANNIADPRFEMHPSAVAAADGMLRLFLPKATEHVSASLTAGSHTRSEFIDVPALSLRTIFRGCGRPDLLKMDIEGAEYSALASLFDGTPELWPRQMALEFHHFYPEIGLQRTRDAIAMIRSRGYQLAWVSPSHHELLFVRSAGSE